MDKQFDRFGLPNWFKDQGGDPGRQALLEQNKRVRTENTAAKLDWATPILSIPPQDYAVLIARYPELNCGDTQIENAAWARFLASTESEPYRIQAQDTGRGRGIIVK